ncbi:hypothetical protein LCGC14_1167880 [marine sediment metagenome]|uniref:Uncharacterized protein n=1 Tax=marine sediment metagenome TaxID=412755 RepID=A0A0F9LQV4_9ZZZZ
MSTAETLVDDNCARCGESSVMSCPDCGRRLCQECREVEAGQCGTVNCVMCGHPVTEDWDTVFDIQGGGLHGRCD